MSVRNIRNIKDLITEAEELERKLAFIEEENDEEDEVNPYLTQLRSLLGTDATAYNIGCLWDFMEYNTEPINLEYQSFENTK